MKKILTPTDFSKPAEIAYRYAIELAKHKGTGIRVVHYFRPELETDYPYSVADYKALLEEKTEQLKRFKGLPSSLSKEEKDLFDTMELELYAGNATEEIIRHSRDQEVDMIVMGTTGEGGVLKKLLGSVSSYVAQKAACPVLLVPREIYFRGFKNILYAVNYELADTVVFQQIIDFADLFGACIHFVHVSKDYSFDSTIREMKVDQFLKEKMAQDRFKIVNIQNGTILDAINKYIEEKEIDLVVMATPHRPFIKDLLHKSLTKEMALNTKTPLMIMHFNTK